MKASVTQDFLYDYIVSHNLNVKTLAEFAGISPSMMYDCFRHTKDTYGRPRNFPVNSLAKLNAALPIMADCIKQSVITFGSEQTFVNRVGRTYDPGCMPAMKALSKYFNLNGLCLRVLGWSKGKKESVLCSPSSHVFGFITSSDVEHINTELLAVFGMLSGIKVILSDSSNTPSSE